VSPDPNVRLEAPSDREASLEVESAAFGRSVEPDIVEAIRDEADSFALVASIGATIVGHVQLSRAWIGEEPVVALGPIAVEPDRQRRGIGSALVGAALEEAARRGERAVVLLGDPEYYGRLGFVPAPVSGCGTRTPARPRTASRSRKATSRWPCSTTERADSPGGSAGTQPSVEGAQGRG
jgi:putative acetyltransferase